MHSSHVFRFLFSLAWIYFQFSFALAAATPSPATTEPAQVTVRNYVRIETARQLAIQQALARGVNQWAHLEALLPLGVGFNQTVIRSNRDTLYSSAVVDIRGGARLTIPPNPEGRYLSVMVMNQNHYVRRVYHDPGTYRLTKKIFGSDYVFLLCRIFVIADNQQDVAKANSLQHGLRTTSNSHVAFPLPIFDADSLQVTTFHLVELAKGVGEQSTKFGERSFGTKREVSEVAHLLGCAAGWGGLPVTEAFYQQETDARDYQIDWVLRVKNPPVDGFWSISVYNSKLFFDEDNPYKTGWVINSGTAAVDSGTTDEYTIYFSNKNPENVSNPNYLYIMEGWSYLVRMYRPQSAILAETNPWRFPKAQPVL